MLTPLLRGKAAQRLDAVEQAGEIGVELGVADPAPVEEAAERERIATRRVEALRHERGGADAVLGEKRSGAGMVGAARVAEMDELGLAEGGAEEGAILRQLRRQRVHLPVDFDVAVGVELDVEPAPLGISEL